MRHTAHACIVPRTGERRNGGRALPSGRCPLTPITFPRIHLQIKAVARLLLLDVSSLMFRAHFALSEGVRSPGGRGPVTRLRAALNSLGDRAPGD